MRNASRTIVCGLLAAASLPWLPAAATAAPLPSRTFASTIEKPAIEIGRRWYRDDDDDDDYYDLPAYDLPPPPVRVYRYQPPPVVVYEPPVYGWIAPPRPSNCGKYRYWNGEYCADARYDPPYTGPRW